MTEATPTSLDDIWSEIGFSEAEKSQEIQRLRTEIDEIHSSFLAAAEEDCETLTSSIDQIKERHIATLRVVDSPESEIARVLQSGSAGNIRLRQREVQSQFDDFYITVYQPRAAEFSHLQSQIQHSSDRLGVSVDPEFSEIGTEDLGLVRLTKFRRRARELDDKLTAEIIRFGALEDEIANLARDLQEDNPPVIQEVLLQQDYSERAFETLTNHLEELRQLFDKRRRYISEMAVEITKLWDLLNVDEYVRSQFMASHTVLSQKNVEDCIAEAERLIALRNSQIPHLIQLMKTDIEHIGSDLSYTKEDLRAIFRKCDEGESDEETFGRYEAELIRLKKLHIAATPILDLVTQREEIIEEFNKLKKAEEREVTETVKVETVKTIETVDTHQKKSYRPRLTDPAEKGRIERIRRRHKVVLPRVEGKLKGLLEQFREQGGVDFVWKDKPLIEELKNVTVPQTARVRKSTATKSLISKRGRNSVSPATWTTTGAQKQGSPKTRKSVAIVE